MFVQLGILDKTVVATIQFRISSVHCVPICVSPMVGARILSLCVGSASINDILQIVLHFEFWRYIAIIASIPDGNFHKCTARFLSEYFKSSSTPEFRHFEVLVPSYSWMISFSDRLSKNGLSQIAMFRHVSKYTQHSEHYTKTNYNTISHTTISKVGTETVIWWIMQQLNKKHCTLIVELCNFPKSF